MSDSCGNLEGWLRKKSQTPADWMGYRAGFLPGIWTECEANLGQGDTWDIDLTSFWIILDPYSPTKERGEHMSGKPCNLLGHQGQRDCLADAPFAVAIC